MQHDSSETNSLYFDAAKYACEILGQSAGKYLARLFDLSCHNSADELKAIVDGWAKGLRIAIPDRRTGPWAVGASWGETTRIEHDKGIFWRVRCRCGKYFKTSTNDSIADAQRKCENCRLADEMSVECQHVVARLKETSNQILEWHKAHNKLVWNRVHKILRERGISHDDDFARELNAMVWVKITTVAPQYADQGHKPSAWLGRVADNCLRDFFKVNTNRERLAPMEPLPLETPDPALAQPPAKPVRPTGAKPDEWRPEKPNRLMG